MYRRKIVGPFYENSLKYTFCKTHFQGIPLQKDLVVLLSALFSMKIRPKILQRTKTRHILSKAFDILITTTRVTPEIYRVSWKKVYLTLKVNMQHFLSTKITEDIIQI